MFPNGNMDKFLNDILLYQGIFMFSIIIMVCVSSSKC